MSTPSSDEILAELTQGLTQVAGRHGIEVAGDLEDLATLAVQLHAQAASGKIPPARLKRSQAALKATALNIGVAHSAKVREDVADVVLSVAGGVLKAAMVGLL